MRVLILTSYFPPEIGAASHLFYDLAETLGEHGHHVTVVTGFPRYMLGAQRQSGLYRREAMGRSKVIRVASSPFDQGGPIRRGLDHMCLAGSLFAGGLLAGRHDVVCMYSPPQTGFDERGSVRRRARDCAGSGQWHLRAAGTTGPTGRSRPNFKTRPGER